MRKPGVANDAQGEGYFTRQAGTCYRCDEHANVMVCVCARAASPACATECYLKEDAVVLDEVHECGVEDNRPDVALQHGGGYPGDAHEPLQLVGVEVRDADGPNVA